MTEKPKIFRDKALERLSSPESLDRLMRIAPARSWLWLAALGLIIGMSVYWSVTGRLPTGVSARGILIHPRRIVEVQAVAEGRLEALYFGPGDTLKKGDLIGKIDQTELRRRLDEDRALLVDLRSQDVAKNTLERQHVTLQSAEADTELRSVEMQRQSFQKSLEQARTLSPTLKRQFDSLKKLRDEGLLPPVSSQLVQAEQSHLENDSKIVDLEARLQQLESQSRKLATARTILEQDSLNAQTSRQNQIQDVLSRIALTQIQLEKNTNIVSEHSGRILDVLTTSGKMLSYGERIATIEVGSTADQFVAIAYFPVGDGKKIKPGMPVQVTPDTVERQRYGGIVGKVSSVSSLPVTRESATVIVGNAEVIQDLMRGGPYVEVVCELQRDTATTSGYRWSSSAGPPSQMSAGLTAMVRATVEERAPITYVLPFLRSLSGIY